MFGADAAPGLPLIDAKARLASELVVDDIVEPEDMRADLIRRYAAARAKDRTPPRRRPGISPA